MKIIGINASPRHDGNTAKLANVFIEGAAAAGAETASFDLERLRIHACIACGGCKNNRNVCSINDDMQILYREIKTADVIMLAFPIYMGQMSAQAKTFVDRLYAFVNQDYTSSLGDSKKLVLGVTQGETDPATYGAYLAGTAEAMRFLGFKVVDTVTAAGLHDTSDIIEKGAAALAKAKTLGGELGKSK